MLGEHMGFRVEEMDLGFLDISLFLTKMDVFKLIVGLVSTSDWGKLVGEIPHQKFIKNIS